MSPKAVQSKMDKQNLGRCRSNLSSLPKELLRAISLLLPDRASILSFALTSRSIHLCCEEALWRDLSISLPVHFGEAPLVQPASQSGDSGAWRKRAEEEAGRVDQARRAAMKAKAQAVLNAADGRKWRMVERMELLVQPGAANSAIQLLEAASPTLRSLALHASPPEPSGYAPKAPFFDTLDFWSIRAGLSFPSLTHLRLGERAIRFAEFIPLLCNASPGLHSLNVDFKGGVTEPWAGVEMPAFRTFDRLTDIRQLRLAFEVDPMGQGSPLPTCVVEILRHSPRVRQLRLESTGDNVCINPITRILMALPELRELSWTITPLDLWGTLYDVRAPEQVVFGHLRKLVLLGENWHDIFTHLPELQDLEILCFDFSPTAALRMAQPSSPTSTIPVQPIPEDFGQALSCSRQLRIIHTLRNHVDLGDFGIFSRLDQDMSSGNAEGYITSLRHNDSSSLLHARLLLDHRELEDVADPRSEEEIDSVDMVSTEYTYIGGGAPRIRTFVRRDEATWQEYSDYGGAVVPSEVLGRMREAAGVEAGEWEGRVIEVGAEAWKVLTDWAEGEKAKKAAGGAE